VNAFKFIVSANLNAQRIRLRSPVVSLLALRLPALRLLAMSLLAMSMTACGQSGPLFLPKAPEPLKTRVEPPKSDGKGDLKDERKADVKADVKAGAQAEPAR
jgi:predicted small lipoprotein YifL